MSEPSLKLAMNTGKNLRTGCGMRQVCKYGWNGEELRSEAKEREYEDEEERSTKFRRGVVLGKFEEGKRMIWG